MRLNQTAALIGKIEKARRGGESTRLFLRNEWGKRGFLPEPPQVVVDVLRLDEHLRRKTAVYWQRPEKGRAEILNSRMPALAKAYLLEVFGQPGYEVYHGRSPNWPKGLVVVDDQWYVKFGPAESGEALAPGTPSWQRLYGKEEQVGSRVPRGAVICMSDRGDLMRMGRGW